MAVQKLCAGGQFLNINSQLEALPEEFHELLEYSILASKRNPLDPMEIAFQQFGSRSLSTTEHLHHDWVLVHEYPLSQALLAMSRVWRAAEGDRYVIAAKGAPEAIAELCQLAPNEGNEVKLRATQMATEGLRILGVAEGEWTQTQLPAQQPDLPFAFVGLVGLPDPIRPEVPAAVEECYRAGIRVVMITGDYPATAQNIARQVGIRTAEQVLGPPRAVTRLQVSTDGRRSRSAREPGDHCRRRERR
jgi:Ca2+-transporting ATPase